MTGEQISVIVPCRDGAAYLGQALESIWRQHGLVREVIVVDDGSVDASNDIARAHGARVVRSDGVGPAAARNTGVRAAQSAWLAFLDADDVWTEGSLQRRWAGLGGEQVCFGEMATVDEPERSQGAVRLPGTMLISTELWGRVGPLAEERLGGYMLEWVDRLSALRAPVAAVAAVPEIVLLRRAHEANLSRRPEMSLDYLYWARVIAARRRPQ